MNQKYEQNIYPVGVNASLMVENVTWIKSEIGISVNVSLKILKKQICAKKIIFEILLPVVVKMINI